MNTVLLTVLVVLAIRRDEDLPRHLRRAVWVAGNWYLRATGRPARAKQFR